jgi:hypothetical protein
MTFQILQFNHCLTLKVSFRLPSFCRILLMNCRTMNNTITAPSRNLHHFRTYIVIRCGDSAVPTSEVRTSTMLLLLTYGIMRCVAIGWYDTKPKQSFIKTVRMVPKLKEGNTEHCDLTRKPSKKIYSLLLAAIRKVRLSYNHLHEMRIRGTVTHTPHVSSKSLKLHEKRKEENMFHCK